MASGSQTAGFAGGLLVAVGAILTVLFPPLGMAWGLTVGPYVVVAGALTQVAVALSARAPSMRRAENSPTYAVDTFRNPRGPDAFVPIVYGTGEDAPRVPGLVLAEGVLSLGETPRAGADVTREQGIRMLLAMAEGPIKEIRDVHFNDTPVFSEEIRDEFTGNGTKKVFELSSPWPHVPRLVVTVDGTQVFNSTTSVGPTRLVFAAKPTGNALDPAYQAAERASRTAKITAGKRERILGQTIKVFRNGTEVGRRDGGLDWSARKISPRQFEIEFNTRPADADVVTVTHEKVAYQDVAFFRTGRGRLILFFGASRVPANGAKIVATYVRENFPNVEIAWTTGAVDQEALPGMEQVVDSQNPEGNRTLAKDTPIQVIAKKEADDIRIGLLAPYGLKHYKDDGSEEAVAVRISIRYAKASGSTFGAWKTLRTLGTEDSAKSWFTLAALRTGRVLFEVSIRRELETLAAAGDEDALVDLEEFTRGTYKVQVERKTTVRQTNDATFVDTIDFAYITTIDDTPYRLPGTALLKISAPVGAAIGNSSPVVTAVVDKGDVADPRTGGTGPSSNNALAIYDLVTSGLGKNRQRYGGGEWFTSDDLAPLTGDRSIGALADWCDDWINPETGAASNSTDGKRRARLSLVIDSPGSLLEWVADMAYAARAFAVLQGVKWQFPIDRDSEPVYDFVEDRLDPLGANIRAGSLTQGPDSFAKEPTELIVQFWNRDNDGKRDEILAYRADLPTDTPRVTSRVSVIGETRPWAVLLLARHLLAAAVAQTVNVAWTGHPGAVLPEAGDVVTVTSERLGWAGVKVRLLAVQRSIGEAEEIPWIRFAGRVHDVNVYGAKPGSIEGALINRPAASSSGGVAAFGPGANSFGGAGQGATSIGNSSFLAVTGLSAQVQNSQGF